MLVLAVAERALVCPYVHDVFDRGKACGKCEGDRGVDALGQGLHAEALMYLVGEAWVVAEDGFLAAGFDLVTGLEGTLEELVDGFVAGGFRHVSNSSGLLAWRIDALL